ncbi:hypothetical protein D3C76_1439380 [compost metagenome]
MLCANLPFFAVEQQVLDGLTVLAGVFPEAALLGFHQALGDVAQGFGVVLVDELAGVFVQQVGVGQQARTTRPSSSLRLRMRGRSGWLWSPW